MNREKEFLKSKRITITGGDGFVGKKLVSKFKSIGVECISLSHSDFDIVHGDINAIESCDILVHLAAYVNPVGSWSNFDKSLYVNSNGTRNMLDFSTRCNADFIYLNTYVYGESGSLPIGENFPVNPNTPYSISKMMGEDLCKFYSQYLGLNITSLRVFNIYGDTANENFLVSKIINQYKNGSKNIDVYSENTCRDFIHVDDVVHAIIRAILKLGSFQVYNIGSGKSHSSRDIFNILNELVNENLTFSCSGISRAHDIKNVICDPSKAYQYLNWMPRISLKEGIKKALNE